MNRLELSLAWRYMRSRRGSKSLSVISLIAIGGVIVAVSALVVIIGVMDGLQNDIREKILIGSPDIRVMRYGRDLIMTDWEPVLDSVRRQPGIVAAGPFVHTQAVVGAAGRTYGEAVGVEGIPSGTPGAPETTGIRKTLIAGDFSFDTPDGREGGAVIGKRLADRLNVAAGSDSVNIYTVTGEIDPMTGVPKIAIEQFKVTGVFETGGFDYDNSYIFVSLAAAQRLSRIGNAVSGIEVKTATRRDAESVGQQLGDRLGAAYRIVDWQQQNSSLFSALKLEKLGMSVILLLIAIVAAFNIISTLIMVVTEKTREIGILRAMGMRARSIRRVFFAQGFIIGIAGTSVGLVIGLVASTFIGKRKLIALDPEIYFIDHLPVTTEWLDVTLIVLASLAIAGIATIYPARQAARLYPVEAIRHE
ncbi:MAG TPA: ABC transporter permease [Gemmatimonadaceae bacterium]|jgi:lipoprotein-releasing system permease protein